MAVAEMVQVAEGTVGEEVASVAEREVARAAERKGVALTVVVALEVAAMAMVDAELVVAVAKVVQRVQVCTVEADLVAVTMVVVALEEAATVMAAVELVAAAVEEVKMAEA